MVEMDLKPPKIKKLAPFSIFPSLPVKKEKRYNGIFDGYNVSVTDRDEMFDVYCMGNFGKGSLSKSRPNYHHPKDDLPKLVLEQQWDNQLKWNQNLIFSMNDEPSRWYLGLDKHLLEEMFSSINNLLQSSYSVIGNRGDWNAWNELSDSQDQQSVSNHVQNVTVKRNYSDDVRTASSESNLENWMMPEREWIKLPNDIDSKRTDEISDIVHRILASKTICKPDLSQISDDEVLVVSGNSSRDENTKAKLEKNPNLIRESLKLNLEESFFLMFAIGCLCINDLEGNELTVNDAWQRFRTAQDDFIGRYVAYHHYRSKGWVVKSGLRYGGDYLLYKTGQAYYHATYLIKVIDGRRNISWKEFVGLNRLTETFSKDLVLCYVLRPEDLSESELTSPEVLTRFAVHECLSKRWIPSQERKVKE